MHAANNTCNLFSFICVAKARVMIDTKICYNKNVLSLQFCPGTASQPKDCATDIVRPHGAQLMIDNCPSFYGQVRIACELRTFFCRHAIFPLQRTGGLRDKPKERLRTKFSTEEGTYTDLGSGVSDGCPHASK